MDSIRMIHPRTSVSPGNRQERTIARTRVLVETGNALISLNRSHYNFCEIFMPDWLQGTAFTDFGSMVEANTVEWLQSVTRVPVEKLQILVNQALHAPELITARYTIHQIPKKSGGMRTIEAPDDVLKEVQRAILHYAVAPAKWWTNQTTGFVEGKSICTNAELHADENSDRYTASKRWLLKMDLKDFFPSITLNQILYALWTELGDFKVILGSYPELETDTSFYRAPHKYGFIWKRSRRAAPGPSRLMKAKELSIWLGLMYLCVLDERLPQGAPTSPALSNLVYKPVDIALMKISECRPEVVYTRYADDLIVTAADTSALFMMKNKIQHVIERIPGAIINPKKTTVLRHGRPMRVTGININHVPSVSRVKRDQIRRRLFLISKKGEVTFADKSELNGHRAFMRGVDHQGWDARCENLFQLMLTLPTR